MTPDELEDKFMNQNCGFSITIKRHYKYKCLSTWEPEWNDGICLLENTVTTSGNNHHPHAKEKHRISDSRITPEAMKKIKEAITKIIKEENIIVE